jgi:glucosamine--fructose-6-phosphate aminotransferase (isomerizing)
MADYHLALGAGEEVSVAATKSYTAELAAIALLTVALLEDERLEAELKRLPQYIEQTLTASSPIVDWIERYRYMERYAVIGRGYNYCTAYEISLKIKELCYITGEEYSEADFRHGPIAVIQAGFPVILVAPKGMTFEKQLDLLQQLQRKGAEVLVISNAPECAAYAKKLMPIPDDIPEWLSPIVAVIPGQIIAMTLALARGHEVDKPRGLTKVTNTA